MATFLVTKLILNFSFLCLETFFPNHFLSVDGKRAYCGPTGSLSYEIQATPILKILGMSYQLLIARQRQAKQGVILDG